MDQVISKSESFFNNIFMKRMQSTVVEDPYQSPEEDSTLSSPHQHNSGHKNPAEMALNTPKVAAEKQNKTYCQLCFSDFGIFQLKNHCQSCGRSCCSQCSVKASSSSGSHRLCDYCQIKAENPHVIYPYTHLFNIVGRVLQVRKQAQGTGTRGNGREDRVAPRTKSQHLPRYRITEGRK